MGRVINGARKIVIVGAGAVGSTFAYTLMNNGVAGEIVLVDVDRERANAEAMDMNHGLFFAPPVEIRAGDYDDCAGAAIVVVTAGSKQRPGESRLNLVQRNVAICKSIVQEITARTREAILIMVTNPVDVLTYVAQQTSDLPRGRVIGSGTVLDSARLRFLLSQHCQVDPRNVHAYVLGEHGDSEFPAWSMSHIAGVGLQQYCRTCPRSCGPLDRDGNIRAGTRLRLPRHRIQGRHLLRCQHGPRTHRRSHPPQRKQRPNRFHTRGWSLRPVRRMSQFADRGKS